MTDNKNNVPQFVACGLEMGNCPRQIPYDMAEHERIIMADLLDKVAEKLHKKMCSENCGERQCVDAMDRCVWYGYVDEVIAELKAEVRENANEP